MPKTVKLTYEYVKDFFAKNNCEMLDDHYKNANEKIKYRCSCGNTSKIRFAHFKLGSRCRKCSTKKGHKKLSNSFERVKKYFSKYGCEILDNDYINVHTKIEYKCSCGNIEFINFNKFRRKRYKCCSQCTLKNNRGKNKWNWIEDREGLKEINAFKTRCRGLLRNSLKRINQLKSDRTYIMLGYSPQELHDCITSHKNWEKVKSEKWHIDHIFPVQAFIDYGVKDVKIINCLENLQPLGAIENMSKNSKYNKEEFEKWLKSQGCKI